MVAIQDALFVLFPSAKQPADYLIQDDGLGEGPYIRQWNLQSPQPSPEAIAAVTQEQVDAAKIGAIRSAAVRAAITSTNTSDTATRAAVNELWTATNDHAEVLGMLMTKLGITREQFIADITARRDGILFEQAPTDPGAIFDELKRLSQSKILAYLGEAIATGAGDPIKV